MHVVFADTDLIINHIRRAPKPLVERAQATLKRLFNEHGTVKRTMFTMGELYQGIFLSRDPGKNKRIVEDLTRNFTIVNFSRPAAVTYGRVSADLRRAGTPVGTIDELIASIVLAANDTLYTRNIHHFTRVTGLHVVNWDGDKGPSP